MTAISLAGALPAPRRGTTIEPAGRAAGSRSASGQTQGPAASTAAPPRALRLTSRGRVALGLAAALVVGPAVVWGGAAVADSGPEPVAVEAYTVVPGETWWSIAAGVAAPGEDVRDVVRRLTELNGTSGTGLQSGQQILVPVDR